MNKIGEIKKQLKTVWEKIQQVHRDEYNHKISRTVFSNRVTPLEEEKNKLNKRLVTLLRKEYIDRDEEQQQAQNKLIEDAKEVNRQRREAKPIIKKQPPKKSLTEKQSPKKPITYKSLIIKALKHEKVDSEEKLLYVVLKKKPGKDKETLRRQVRNIISIIKKSDKYIFNDKKYQVKKKEN